MAKQKHISKLIAKHKVVQRRLDTLRKNGASSDTIARFIFSEKYACFLCGFTWGHAPLSVKPGRRIDGVETISLTDEETAAVIRLREAQQEEMRKKPAAQRLIKEIDIIRQHDNPDALSNFINKNLRRLLHLPSGYLTEEELAAAKQLRTRLSLEKAQKREAVRMEAGNKIEALRQARDLDALAEFILSYGPARKRVGFKQDGRWPAEKEFKANGNLIRLTRQERIAVEYLYATQIADLSENQETRGRGYIGYSRSVNAVNAERQGKKTASALAKALKVDTQAVRDHLRPCEWHHTSSWYNETSYYRYPLLEALAACQDVSSIPSGYTEDEIEQARTLLNTLREESRARRRNRKPYQLHCSMIEWIEWVGTRRSPRAKHKTLHNVYITVSGSMVTIHGPDGDVRKRIGTKGFQWR